LSSWGVKTFLILEGSDENHFELKEPLILSRLLVCNLKKIVERAVQIWGPRALIDRKMF